MKTKIFPISLLTAKWQALHYSAFVYTFILIRTIQKKQYSTFKLKVKLKNIHPGEILSEEFIIPFNITAYRLAKDIEIPQTRISEIIKGNRRITADTALRLSKYFGNSAKFWLGLQDDFDIEEEIAVKRPLLKSIKTLNANVA